jgi:hypothetical protein
MGVRLSCPDCGYSLDGTAPGDRPPCAGCRQRLLLSMNARRRDDDEDDDEDDDRPRKKKRTVAEDDEDDDRPRKKKPASRDDDDDDDRPRKKKRPVAEADDDEEEEVKPRKKSKIPTRDKDDDEEHDEEDERKPIKPGSRRDKMTKVKGGVISFSVAVYCLLALFVLGGFARSFGLWFGGISVVVGYLFQFFFLPLVIGVPVAFIVGNVFALWLPPRAEGRAFAIAGIALMSLGLVMHFFGYAFVFGWIMQGDPLRAGRLGYLLHVGTGFAFLLGFYASMLFLKQLSLFLGNRPLSNVPLTWAGFFTIVLVLNYLLIQFIGDMLAFGLWMIHVINGIATALSVASLYIFIMMAKMLDEFRVMVQQDIDKK